jgi:hypothetical protein
MDGFPDGDDEKDFDALFGSNVVESDALPFLLGTEGGQEVAASSASLEIFDVGALEHMLDCAVDVGILEEGVPLGLTIGNYDTTVIGGFGIGYDSAQTTSLSASGQQLIDNPEVSDMPATTETPNTSPLYLMPAADNFSIPGRRDSLWGHTTELAAGTPSRAAFNFTHSAFLEEFIHLDDSMLQFTLPQPQFSDASNEIAKFRDGNYWQDLGSKRDQSAVMSLSLKPATPTQHGNDTLGKSDSAISIAATKRRRGDSALLESNIEFTSSHDNSLGIANPPRDPKMLIPLQNTTLGGNENWFSGVQPSNCSPVVGPHGSSNLRGLLESSSPVQPVQIVAAVKSRSETVITREKNYGFRSSGSSSRPPLRIEDCIREFNAGQKILPYRRRKRFTPSRRIEVAKIRGTGACRLCRTLKLCVRLNYPDLSFSLVCQVCY